jgi:hypothetical protein
MRKPNGIDLKPFCLNKRDAYYRQKVKQILTAPFSIGDHTYASNGHICVRIPRRPDVAEVKETSDTSRLWLAPKLFLDSVSYRQLARLNLPATRELKTWKVFVRIGGAPFQANYLRLMLALPGLQVSKTLRRHVSQEGLRAPVLRFCFDGGEGVLMSAPGVKTSITARFMRAPREEIAP